MPPRWQPSLDDYIDAAAFLPGRRPQQPSLQLAAASRTPSRRCTRAVRLVRRGRGLPDARRPGRRPAPAPRQATTRCPTPTSAPRSSLTATLPRRQRSAHGAHPDVETDAATGRARRRRRGGPLRRMSEGPANAGLSRLRLTCDDCAVGAWRRAIALERHHRAKRVGGRLAARAGVERRSYPVQRGEDRRSCRAGLHGAERSCPAAGSHDDRSPGHLRADSQAGERLAPGTRSAGGARRGPGHLRPWSTTS